MWDPDQPRPRIVGKLTHRFVGRPATLVGRCLTVDTMGKQLKFKCADDEIILVQMASPVSQHIDPNAYVEIGGIVETRNKFRGHTLFVYQPEKEFDFKLYCDMVELALKHGDSL